MLEIKYIYIKLRNRNVLEYKIALKIILSYPSTTNSYFVHIIMFLFNESLSSFF